ncbi:Protein disulfide-isomerase [Actinidia chinensis var. chinensis]|uniref:Protein disulfide-isomerase n=2 Tax=Actinidia TaxID=3624 RepID=A0A2R6Q190_ACTCC|nr:Protein disulfide-isomerase [Actinidia chinensis var. chinensis]
MKLILLALSIFLSLQQSISSSLSNQFAIDGKVLELTESNFDAAISTFDYIFVDFYAPWCGHCKRLSPELDKAAPILAGLKEPIVIAKVNADQFTRLAKRFDIDGFPTLKVFMHGIPTEYYGPRKADLLVRYLKKFVAPDVAVLKFVAPDVAVLNSDSGISDFIEAAGTDFPIYVGFGLNESVISDLAIKYKKKAWFSVAKDFTDDVMVLYDFDKVPALASVHPNYNERSIFYGPFEDQFLEDFVKQNLFPLAVPINYEALKLLKDDERKIVLTIMEDAEDEKCKELIKLLKAAASANRDLVFGYVGVKQWEDFAETFELTKKTKLPKMVVWDGNEEYFSVIGSESMDEYDQGSQITRFLEGYRGGSVIQKQVSGPSLMGYINSLIGIRTIYIFVFVVAVIMLIQTIGKEEPLTVGTRDQVDHASSSTSQGESKEVPRLGEKED